MKKMSCQELNELFEECKAKLESINIPFAKDIKLKVDTKSKFGLGVCKSKDRKSYVIEVSEFITTNRDFVENTIIHELLHTCKDCMNHGKLWKSYAERVNRSFNICIKRVCDESFMKDCGIVTPESKYVVYCDNCGKSWERHKKTRLITNPEEYQCSCGCKELKVKQNY